MFNAFSKPVRMLSLYLSLWRQSMEQYLRFPIFSMVPQERHLFGLALSDPDLFFFIKKSL